MRITRIIAVFTLFVIIASCSDITTTENKDMKDEISDEQIEKIKKELLSGNEEQSFVERVSLAKFQEKLSTQAYTLLDLRTTQELQDTWIISWAENIDFYNKDFRGQLDTLDKNKKYLIYCRSGNRSWQALETMKQMGFTTVYELEWWINGWIASGWDTVSINTQ